MWLAQTSLIPSLQILSVLMQEQRGLRKGGTTGEDPSNEVGVYKAGRPAGGAQAPSPAWDVLSP